MYNDELNKFISTYKSEFGERKFRKIESDVNTGQRFNVFLSECKQRKFLPQADNFIHCAMDSIKYSFASKYKVTVTALLLFKIWDDEINQVFNIEEHFILEGHIKKIISSARELG